MLSFFLVVFMVSVLYCQFHLCLTSVVLEFNPNLVITGETVKMILRTPAVGKAKFATEMARYYHIETVEAGDITKSRCKLTVVIKDLQCETIQITDTEKYGDCFKLQPISFKLAKDCSSVEVLIPSTKELQGIYNFDLETIENFSSSHRVISANVLLKVGDKTPPIQSFAVSDAVTKCLMANNTELAMNLNLSITCTTTAPQPTFTVKITDKDDRNQQGKNSITFYEVVPRATQVFFTCSVFNGFGTRQSSVLAYTAKLSPTTPQELKQLTTIPEFVTLDYNMDLELCRVQNNPPKPISISDFNPDIFSWFEAGYPKYSYDNLLSVAVIKLKKDNKIEKDNSKIEFKCTYQPGHAEALVVNGNTSFVKKTGTMNTSKSNFAMMIALVVTGIFLLVVITVIVLILIYKQHQRKQDISTTQIKTQIECNYKYVKTDLDDDYLIPNN